MSPLLPAPEARPPARMLNGRMPLIDVGAYLRGEPGALEANAAELRFALRVRDIRLDLVTDAESPVAALLKSGALDLSRPGDLVKFLPNRSPALVEAEGDRIVVDGVIRVRPGNPVRPVPYKPPDTAASPPTDGKK